MANGKFNKKLIFLLVAALLVTSFATTTLAAYKTTESGSGSATAAKFVLNTMVEKQVEGEDQSGSDEQSVQIVAVDYYPGMDDITYEIEVANFEGDVICDVPQEYSVSVSSTCNLPLKFKLEKKQLDSENIVYDSYDDGVTSDSYSFDAGSGRTDEYILTISWDEAEDDPKYASEIDLIMVTVSSVQMMTADSE